MTRSEIFKLAHSIKGEFLSFGAALKTAWYASKIKEGKEREFAYFKTDGTVRIARVGQYDPATIKGTSKGTRPINQIAYFDAEKGEWRSFLAQNLIAKSSYTMAFLKARYESTAVAV